MVRVRRDGHLDGLRVECDTRSTKVRNSRSTTETDDQAGKRLPKGQALNLKIEYEGVV